MRNLIASKPLSLMPKTSELPFICSRLGEIRFSEPATIQPSIPRRDGEVTRSGYRTAARGICTADDGSRTFPRRGNCQEEWFRRSRADATVVRPGIRTVATGDSTHGKRVEGISGRPIRGSKAFHKTSDYGCVNHYDDPFAYGSGQPILGAASGRRMLSGCP